MKKFTLFDFPKDRVYILLEDTFRKKFFDETINTLGSQSALARKLNVSSTMIKKWRIGKNKPQKGICEQGMPLWAIIKIYQITKGKFSLDKIQNAVLKYRAKGGFSVINPNLPLIEDQRLLRIFFHLAGDGFAGHFGGAQVNYYNTDREVMKEFIKDLSVFGRVKIKLRENGKRLGFPKVIGHILQHIYRTNFKSEEVKMPSHFFRLKKNLILKGIRALMDDEATVEFSKIRIVLKNKPFLSDVARLLKNKTSFGNHISVSLGEKFAELRIKAGGMELYRREINFVHSMKRRRLNFYLRIKKKGKFPKISIIVRNSKY
jgi:hypothetical protein